MSQNRKSLDIIIENSGYKDYILRPLSAKLLEPIIPERDGRIDRERLLDINGRSRKRQLELAKKFHIDQYPNPGGGCLLTDRSFSNRLRELLSFNQNPTPKELNLLRIGRHYRILGKNKFIVGRNEAENNQLLENIVEGDTVFSVEDFSGPTCILKGQDSEEVLNMAAVLCASYSDAGQGEECLVCIKSAKSTLKIKVTADKSIRERFRIN